jgi:methylmalonyl-CoA mutase C-terminal domain/subunit
MTAQKIKILIGKPGLDGHDRGAKVIALALRDAGMEVIYTGLHQTIEEIVRMAVQEAVDIVGLSIMSGAHLPISKTLLELMKEQEIEDIPVAVGGVIPKQDISKLKELGIKGVFPGGTRFDEVIAGIKEIVN